MRFVSLLFVAGLFILLIVDAIRFARRWSKGGRDRGELLSGIMSVAAMINFYSFIFVDVLIGGDALNGRIVGGRYFLGSHGSYTEVSHRVFIYSECHALLAMLGIAFLVGLARKRQPGKPPAPEKPR